MPRCAADQRDPTTRASRSAMPRVHLGPPLFCVLIACQPIHDHAPEPAPSEPLASAPTPRPPATVDDPGCPTLAPDFGVPASSTIAQAVVSPVGPGVRVELPAAWLTGRARDNLHLSRGALRSVREGAGEWDTEYAAVLAELLDFDRCAAHVGGEGWGTAGASFADLQLRVYTVRETPAEIVAHAEAQHFAGIVPQISVDHTGPWTQLRLAYDLHYGDYGGRANVDVRMHRFGDATAVLAGMYVDGRGRERELEDILATACWDSGDAGCCEATPAVTGD